MKMKKQPAGKTHYEFRYVSPDPAGQMLLCPHCREALSRSDIEAFSRCPFCDCKLELNDQLEEFMLRPAMLDWFRESLRQGPFFPGM